MKKQYLDYAGLKRVLKHLLPGARKIWHGTLAEWEALSETERDKYDQAEIIDGSGYQSDYVRNLHDPDWSQAVSITVDQLSSGYTVPGRGIVVGWAIATKDKMYITVNDVVIGASTYKNMDWTSFANIQVPVNKNDVIKASEPVSLTNASFVPYKAQ